MRTTFHKLHCATWTFFGNCKKKLQSFHVSAESSTEFKPLVKQRVKSFLPHLYISLYAHLSLNFSHMPFQQHISGPTALPTSNYHQTSNPATFKPLFITPSPFRLLCDLLHSLCSPSPRSVALLSSPHHASVYQAHSTASFFILTHQQPLSRRPLIVMTPSFSTTRSPLVLPPHPSLPTFHILTFTPHTEKHFGDHNLIL